MLITLSALIFLCVTSIILLESCITRVNSNIAHGEESIFVDLPVSYKSQEVT